jgi:hypothetical protein
MMTKFKFSGHGAREFEKICQHWRRFMSTKLNFSQHIIEEFEDLGTKEISLDLSEHVVRFEKLSPTPKMPAINTAQQHDDEIQFLRYCRGTREDLSATLMILVAEGDRELLNRSTLRAGMLR